MDTFTSEEDTVLLLHYQGATREKIHEKTGISTGKISNIIANEKKRLGEGLVDAIRRIGKELYSNGGSWPDLAHALPIYNFCKKHGLDSEELKDSLPAIVEKLKEHGLRLPDLPLDIEDKVKEGAKLDTSANTLKDEIISLEDNKAKMLKDAGHTEESLAKCRELTDFLTAHKISPADAPEKLKNAISNAEVSGYDGNVMAEKASSVESLDMQIITLEHDVAAKQKEKDDIELAVDGQRIEHWKDKEAIDSLKFLKENGVKAPDILAIKFLV